MVRELITARGSTFQNPPANFFRFTRDPKVAMETTTQLFLGVRMVCAQCHDHPFEKWTQNQYFQLTAFFGAVGIKDGMDSNEEIIYDKREEAEIHHPKDNRVMPAKFLFGGENIKPQEAHLPRSLADWLTSPSNDLFGKSMANRDVELLLRTRHHRACGRYPCQQSAGESATAGRPDERFRRPRLRSAAPHPHDRQFADLPAQLSMPTNGTPTTRSTSRTPPRGGSTAEELYDGIYIATGHQAIPEGSPQGLHAEQFPDPASVKAASWICSAGPNGRPVASASAAAM